MFALLRRETLQACSKGGLPGRGLLPATKAGLLSRRGTSSVMLKKSGFIHLEEGEKVLFFTNLIITRRMRFDYRFKIGGQSHEYVERLLIDHCIPPWMLEREEGRGLELGTGETKDLEKHRKANRIEILATVPRPKDGGVFVKYRLQSPSSAISRKVLKPAVLENTVDDLSATPSHGDAVVYSSTVDLPAEISSATNHSGISDSSRVERDQNPKPSDAEQRQNEMVANEIANYLTDKRKSQGPEWIAFLRWRKSLAHLGWSSKTFRRWFSLRRTKVFAVLGSPWLEDLNRFPTHRLNFEFTEGHRNLSQQAVYALCRQYGKIADIVTKEPKVKGMLPGNASVRFQSLDAAVAARNCLDGYWVPEMRDIHGKEKGIRLSILYERATKRKWIADTFVSYSKITLPFTIALVAFLVIAVFDPVRVWFIQLRITGYEDLLRRALPFNLPASTDKEQVEHPLDETEREALKKLDYFLADSTERSVVILGHRRDKRDIVSSHLGNRSNVLIVDCKPITDAVDEVNTIKAAAREVGYFPVFSSINLLLDLAVQAALGPTEGVSKSLETQLQEIILHTKQAIRHIAVRDKPAGMSEYEYLRQNPEARPILIIDNFLHQDSNSIIYEKLAECASSLVSELYCHVIFLTTDTSFSKSLPNPLFRTIPLSASAIPATVSETASEVWSLYIRPSTARKIPWTPEQAWFLITALAANDALRYDEVLLDDLFREQGRAKGERALQYLEREALITVNLVDGMPTEIVPGRQVDREAFKQLVSSPRLRMMMDLQTLRKRAKLERERIQRKEEELRMMGGLRVQPRRREEYLLEKIESSHRKIEVWERKIRACRTGLGIDKKKKEEAVNVPKMWSLGAWGR